MKQRISAKRAVESAAASLKMEGMPVTSRQKEWCKQLLNKEITKAEYVRRVTEEGKGSSHGI